MTELIKHPEFGTIRNQTVNSEPWFCAKDVCQALGYANPRYALKIHCRQGGVVKHYTPTVSGIQEMNFINEGNLYRLILKSQLPAAEKFENWVCDEVLPAIRRTGEYVTPAAIGRKRRQCASIDVMNLLWLIDENLKHGDKKSLALEIGVSEQSIQHVLNGQYRSPVSSWPCTKGLLRTGGRASIHTVTNSFRSQQINCCKGINFHLKLKYMAKILRDSETVKSLMAAFCTSRVRLTCY